MQRAVHHPLTRTRSPLHRGWFAVVLLLAVSLPEVGAVQAADREGVLAEAVRVADRFAELRAPRRSWRSAPYLVGCALVWEQLQHDGIDAGQLWQRVDLVTTTANDPVLHADHSAYAQAALDLLRLAAAEDVELRQAKLAVTDAPRHFAELVISHDTGSGEPIEGWWVATGYGSRYWQDDLFMVVPWLAMRGSGRELLPADGVARNLAYEWLEAYAFDHRKSLSDEPDAAVPTLAERRSKPADPADTHLLRDPTSGLWWHDLADVGTDRLWGRGNGWVAAALVRAQYFLDAPYSGDRFSRVSDRIELRRMLSTMAESLLPLSNAFGTWDADLAGHQPLTRAESSGTALLVYALARAINEGWLDEDRYAPVVLKAFHALTCLVDDEGDLHRIQRAADPPNDLALLASDYSGQDLAFGVGAFLMAAAEVARLPEERLAQLEETEAVVIERSRFSITDGRLLIAASELGDLGPEAADARALAAVSAQQLLAAGYEDGTVWVEQGAAVDDEVVLFLEPQPQAPIRSSVVAATANLAGVGGRWWHSDLVLLNPGGRDLSAELVLSPQSSASRPVLQLDVAAGTSLVLPDLLATDFGIIGAGSLTVRAGGPLLVSSRTRTESGGGSMGQLIPGLERVESLADGEEVLLLQLERSNHRYTNLGCANLGSRPATVRFRIFSGDGLELTEVSADLEAHGWWQRTDALPECAGGCHAVVSGRGDLLSLLPYASVVNRRSGDPSMVLPQRVSGAVAAGHTMLLSAAAHTGGIAGTSWRSDVVVHSCGDAPARLVVSVLPTWPETSRPQPLRLGDLQPGTSTELPDLLDTLLGLQGTAALSFAVSSGAVLVTSRTYTRSTDGDLGQVIPGVPMARALRAGDTAFITQLAHSPERTLGQRSNLGLVNAAELPIVVSIELVAADGNRLGRREITLPALTHRQLNDVLRPLSGDTLAGVHARVSTMTAGARLVAYASVVDNSSGDPIYLPAQPLP